MKRAKLATKGKRPQLKIPGTTNKQEPTLIFEKACWEKGTCFLAGVDEAGRGPLAGPVIAAALLIPPHFWFPGVRDSKQLSQAKRASLFLALSNHPDLVFGVGVIDAEMIDKVNIYQATLLAMKQAVCNLPRKPDFLLVDAMDLSFLGIPCQKVIHGDALCFSIAAASIVAKEIRDRLMEEYDAKWPEYGFRRHRGYGTRAHLEAIKKYGPCPIHRRSFAPFSRENSALTSTEVTSKIGISV